MMITQSFLYNAIFFTYVLVLENFFKIPQGQTPYYFFPFAIGNLVGPLVLGRLFDSWGRRQMIFLTYGLAGLVLAVSAFLFSIGAMTAPLQVTFWCVAFFFASAGASSAYLTVSEIFPLEIRSQAISYFFAVAQIFGALGPIIFGALVGDGKQRGPLVIGDYVGCRRHDRRRRRGADLRCGCGAQGPRGRYCPAVGRGVGRHEAGELQGLIT